MEVRTCIKCGNYRYIQNNGMCRECYNGSGEVKNLKDFPDRFKSSTPNQLTIGCIGSGKMYGTRVEIDKLKKNYGSNISVYILDPLNRYASISKKHGFVKINAKDKNKMLSSIPKSDTYISLSNVSSISSELMLNYVEKAFQISRNSSGYKALFIDEAHLMNTESSLKSLQKILSMSRSQNLGINIITQKIDDLIKPRSSVNIKSNCSIRRVHRLSTISRRGKKYLCLSDKDADFISQGMPSLSNQNYVKALYTQSPKASDYDRVKIKKH